MSDKPYSQYRKDKKKLSPATARAVEEKIKSGAMGTVSAKKMKQFRDRDWEENRAAYAEAMAEQARLKAAAKSQRFSNRFKRNVPKKLRQEWGERMNHLRSIVNSDP